MNEQASGRSLLIAIIIVLITIGVASVLVFISQPDPVQIVVNPPVPTATPAPTNTPPPITVYITGAVANPQQQITVPYASRVSDVLEQVGGTTENADLERVNLAGIVRDGDQIHVPVIEEPAIAAENPQALPTPSGGDVIYINTATLEELVTLPGIGAVTAERIIAYRDENGRFVTPDDLDAVSGIGPATLENILPLISFE